MKQIPLLNGGHATVSDEDYPYLSRFVWKKRNTPGSKTWYARRWDGTQRKEVPMHREVMGHPEGLFVDHIDGDGLNNTRENLRACVHAENMRNQRHDRVNNSSGYKGVTWYEPSQLWRAQISLNGKRMSLGYFKTKEEAAICYNHSATKLFGEFAQMNVIPDQYKSVVPQPVVRGTRAFKTNRSGYAGVGLFKSEGNYGACVGYQGQRLYVGRFSTAEEAAYVVDQVRLQLYPGGGTFNILDKEAV